ncbi:hypothetical protein LH20_05555 [Sphingopyxis sp. 113P3]|nr:hypothetical protein LH20_05555 [Sphingopyxis sp. 113P3]
MGTLRRAEKGEPARRSLSTAPAQTRPGGPLTLKAPARKKRPTVRWGAF